MNYGISTLIGYLMLNAAYIYIYIYIWIVSELSVGNIIFKWANTNNSISTQLDCFKYFYLTLIILLIIYPLFAHS